MDDCCPATGLYDLTFKVYDALSTGTQQAGTVTKTATPVTNGLFTVNLDFGSTPFTGARRWLEIDARTNNAALPFVTLTPRTELTPTPYAITAQSVPNSAITGPNIASGQVVKSLNGLTDAISLVAGANVTLTPSGNGLQISATGGATGWGLSGNNISPGQFLGTLNNAPLEIRAPNGVGIGTATPGSTLHLRNPGNSTYLTLEKLSAAYEAGLRFTTAGANRWWVYSDDTSDDFMIHSGGEVGSSPRFRLPSANNDILLGLSGGNVGIGTTTPTEKLHIRAGNGLATKLDGNTISFTRNDGPAYIKAENVGGRITFVTNGRVTSDANANLILLTDMSSAFNGNLGIGTLTPQAKLHVVGDARVEGTVTTGVLTITGGADLAEPFQMSGDKIPAGSVVVIDEENPGHLKQATRAYDTRVAGIISGANGVKAGISLHQEGLLEGGQNVALTGRVFVKVDASFGAIKPGDLLTTSDTPGHAMKVTDSSKSQGAILGKAMTALNEGQGTVLVLVSLQ